MDVVNLGFVDSNQGSVLSFGIFSQFSTMIHFKLREDCYLNFRVALHVFILAQSNASHFMHFNHRLLTT